MGLLPLQPCVTLGPPAHAFSSPSLREKGIFTWMLSRGMGHLTEGLDSHLLLEAGDTGLGHLAWGTVPGETASISHYPSAMAHTEKTLALSSRPWRCWQGQGQSRHAPAFVHQQRPPQGFLNDIKLAGPHRHPPNTPLFNCLFYISQTTHE